MSIKRNVVSQNENNGKNIFESSLPFFSIIVPVYNVEKYLDECILSVVNQTYSSWELVLVNDGSTDKSYDICCKYSEKYPHIKVISQENGGGSKARNTGLDNAMGKYVVFLDSDDFYNDVSALEILSKKILEKDADVVIFGCTDFNMITGETVVSRTGYKLDLMDIGNYSDTLHYLLFNKKIPGGPCIFATRRDLIEDNLIRYHLGIQDEDYDFVMSVFLTSKSIFAVNNPFYMYRKGRNDSVTGSSNIKMIYGIDYTVNKWLPICEKMENEVIKKDILNYLAFIYSTGFVILGRMDKSTRKKASEIMKKNIDVLKYAYWKKPKIARIAVKILGINLFSILAAKYFNRTHI